MASTLFIPGTVVRSIWLNEVDKATHNALTAVAGTNAITATGPLTSVAYVTGDRFFFVPAITNTGATTININGLGVKNLTKYGVSALVAGDLVAGTAAQIYYDGVQFQLTNPQTVNVNEVGRLIGTQTLSVSGNYTPTAGTNSIVAHLYGGGGAGGGCPATAGGQNAISGGGGSGGWAVHRATSGFSGSAYVIGAGGTGVVGAAGNIGGNTTFLGVTAFGGAAGVTGTVSGTQAFGQGGAGANQSTGANITNVAGAPGSPGLLVAVGGVLMGGNGGSSALGGGAGLFGGIGAGIAGKTNSAGGSGAAILASTAAVAGGAGIQGVIYVYEYS